MQYTQLEIHSARIRFPVNFVPFGFAWFRLFRPQFSSTHQFWRMFILRQAHNFDSDNFDWFQAPEQNVFEQRLQLRLLNKIFMLPPWPSKTAKRELLLSERGETAKCASSMKDLHPNVNYNIPHMWDTANVRFFPSWKEVCLSVSAVCINDPAPIDFLILEIKEIYTYYHKNLLSTFNVSTNKE